MYRDEGDLRLSASDLMRFQGCAHATALDLRFLDGDATLAPVADDEGSVLVQTRGHAHEAAHLASLEAEGQRIVRIDTDGRSLGACAGETRAALAGGPPVVYQAALTGGRWGGYADFLERVERPSRLGDFAYEIVDTKLKRSPDPKFLLQLCLYADLLAGVQGVVPEQVHVVLGDGRRVSFRVADFAAYVRRVRDRLEAFVADPPATRPEPVSACTHCRWRDRCAEEWDRADHLSLVAGITAGQRRRLEAAGIASIGALARSRGKVPKLAIPTLDRLRRQARLQHARRQGGPPAFELRPVEPGRGLARLPEPDPGDLFFDMEGDPLVEGGLEYLFGILHGTDGAGTCEAVWAHDRQQEGAATAHVLDLFDRHLRRHPRARIYHYNHYEVTALKRLASMHGVGEAVLDRLLREQRFVDLYRVVQQGLIASEPGYSIKHLEAFYRPARAGAVASGGDSIVAYETFRETGDAALLEDIRAYNEEDCRSTRELRDWLVATVRPKGMPWWQPDAKPGTAAGEPDAAGEAERARAALGSALDAARPRLGDAAVDLVFELTGFHRREDKPAWWAMFDRADRESEELVDDLECLAGLDAAGAARPDKRSQERTYRYPEQETKLRAGSEAKARLEGLPTVTITDLEPDARRVTVRFGPRAGDPPDRLDLIPGGPLDNRVLHRAVVRFAEDVAAGTGGYPALEDLLLRRPPRLKRRRPGRPIVGDDADTVAATAEAVAAMSGTVMPVQGPPGTGKTYVSARAIVHLVRQGRRVGISSNAHKAIDNLLRAVVQHARAEGIELRAIKRASDDEDADGFEVATGNQDGRLFSYELVAGTAWLFAREEHDRAFDYLFVDEAGQVSLANIVAMGTAARNLVLVGDPMQLPQPVQGAHPGDSGLSALEHALAGHATVPPDRGIFLPVTRRLHPAVCRYISEVVYEGRLRTVEGAERQALVLKGSHPGVVPAGIGFVEVAHAGNGQTSEEEAGVVARMVGYLLKQRFRDRDGGERRLRLADILVVSPYNAQVNLLARRLPAGARVGTVDRFQGQEAPVCLVSMATSSVDELPRDVGFLFSRNRLNVALSRAQAFACVVASPRLLEVPCRTVDEMALVNALCAAHEHAAAARAVSPARNSP